MNNTSAVVISLGLRDVLLEEKAQQIASVIEQANAVEREIQGEVEGHLSRLNVLKDQQVMLRDAYMALTERQQAMIAAQQVTIAPPEPVLPRLQIPQILGDGDPILKPQDTLGGKPLAGMSDKEIFDKALAARNAEIEAAQRQPHVKSTVEAVFFQPGEPRPNGSTRADDALAQEMIEERNAALVKTPAEDASKAEAAPSTTNLPAVP